jgi:ABC-type Fe3+ transport system permease subunit
VAVALPGVLLAMLLVAGMARRWERGLPPRAALMAPPLLFPLGRLRWPAGAVALAAAGLFLGLPVGSLVWRAGLHGTPPAWSGPVALRHLLLVARADGRLITDSLLLAGGAGVLCAGLGLLACWAALGAGWFRTGLLALMALAWALPGPVAGFGLKGTIEQVLNLTEPRPPAREDDRGPDDKPATDGLDPPRKGLPGAGRTWRPPSPLARALWYGPSLAPVLWADLLRLFPCAVAVLWPVVRLLPPELRDAARVDGARPPQELRLVVWPLAAPACLRAARSLLTP